MRTRLVALSAPTKIDRATYEFAREVRRTLLAISFVYSCAGLVHPPKLDTKSI